MSAHCRRIVDHDAIAQSAAHTAQGVDSEVDRGIPSGDPTPSRADIEMTRLIIETAKPLGISVHDHIIIGKHNHASIKGLALI